MGGLSLWHWLIVGIIVLLLFGCGNKSSDHATPKGAKVIEWEASKSDREAFRTATFENRATRDDVITVKTCADDVKLKLISPLRPAILTDEADDFTYLVMPIRLPG